MWSFVTMFRWRDVASATDPTMLCSCGWLIMAWSDEVWVPQE